MQKQENQFWSKWNDENTAELKKLWGMGLSAGVISQRMSGFSRNAIIGKVHRLGLPGRATPIGRFRTKSVRTKSRRPLARPQIDRMKAEKLVLPKPTLNVVPLPPEPPKPDKLFKLVDMESDQCRFMYGDPKSSDSGFCGCKTATGSSYCAYHAQICTNAVQPVSTIRARDIHNPRWAKGHRKGAIGIRAIESAQEFDVKGAEEFIRA